MAIGTVQIVKDRHSGVAQSGDSDAKTGGMIHFLFLLFMRGNISEIPHPAIGDILRHGDGVLRPGNRGRSQYFHIAGVHIWGAIVVCMLGSQSAR